jgi:hypothetical protein
MIEANNSCTWQFNNASANVILLRVLWKYYIQTWRNKLLVIHHDIMRMDCIKNDRQVLRITFLFGSSQRYALAEVTLDSMSCEGFLVRVWGYFKEHVQVLQSILLFAATSIITLCTDHKWHSEYAIYGEGGRCYREVQPFKILHMWAVEWYNGHWCQDVHFHAP